jgi:hypothetical protein
MVRRENKPAARGAANPLGYEDFVNRECVPYGLE